MSFDRRLKEARRLLAAEDLDGKWHRNAIGHEVVFLEDHDNVSVA
ncbi:MAG: hypothetical protein ACN4GK_08435 [Acidimicrobiia bacterium]